MKYVKIMLTLLVVATLVLAWVMHRPAPPVAIQPVSEHSPLGIVIDSMDLSDAAIETVVRAIHDKTGVDIQVDWDSFVGTAFLVSRTAQITLSTRNIRLAELLHVVFGPSAGLDAFGNSVSVYGGGPQSTFDFTVRTYDVRDLLTDQFWGVKSPPGEKDEFEDARIHDLMDTIEAISNSDGSNVPRDGHARAVAGRLVVTATRIGHQKTGYLLALLRQMR